VYSLYLLVETTLFYGPSDSIFRMLMCLFSSSV